MPTVVTKRHKVLHTKLVGLAQSLKNQTGYTPVLASVLEFEANKLFDITNPTQEELRLIEQVMNTVKLSNVITGVAKPQPKQQLDPWDLTDDDDATPMVEVISQPQTDKAMWQAALSYYGLPVAYSRFVKSMPIADSTEGKTKLVFTNVEDAAKDNRACWLQVNEPAKSYLAPKPNISHIVTYRNLTLDFEYPPNPYLCHAIGVELAQWLVGKGYAHEGLAVEDSGAGSHIVLPLVEIDVTKQVNGGGETLNKAVASVVDTYIKPQFEVIANRYGLSVGKAGDTRLEAYNIDRILSIPGTFRPANSKPNEATHLANGYMRKWLAPYDKQGVYPVRKESQVLHDLIMSTCLSVQNQQITTQQKVNELQQQKDMVSTNNDVTQVVHIDGGKRVNYQSWLEDYANRNPPTRSKAKGGGYARHAYFAKLVSATLKRFEVDGRSLVLANANLIDDIAGRGDPDGAKFKGKAYQQVERCLQTA